MLKGVTGIAHTRGDARRVQIVKEICYIHGGGRCGQGWKDARTSLGIRLRRFCAWVRLQWWQGLAIWQFCLGIPQFVEELMQASLK